MIDPEAMARIEELSQKYEYNWGKEVDYTGMPSGISQDRLAIILERIVETGESVLVGWEKCFSAGNDS